MAKKASRSGAKKSAGRKAASRKSGRKSSRSKSGSSKRESAASHEAATQETPTHEAAKPDLASGATQARNPLTPRASRESRMGGAGISAAVTRASTIARGGVDERATAKKVAATMLSLDSTSVRPADLSGLEADKLYFRIGEVSQITGVKPYVLRYWETEFRLMSPQKSRSKQRLYRKDDIMTILHIKRLLYEERYTIAGARQRLRELGAAGVRNAAAATLGAAREEPSREPERMPTPPRAPSEYGSIRDELLAIRELLTAEIAGGATAS